MKRDKKILDITQDSLNTLKDEDFKRKLLLEQEALIEERALKKAKGRRFNFAFNFKALASAITCLALISVIICVGIFVPVKQDSPSNNGNKNYFGEYEEFRSVEVEEVINVLEHYNIQREIIVSSTVVYDKISGDILYYYFNCETEFTNCRVMLVSNSRYEIEEKTTNNIVKIKDISIDILADYSVEDGIYLHNVYGKTVIDGVRVYFDKYNSMSLSEDSGFEQFVAELFGIA